MQQFEHNKLAVSIFIAAVLGVVIVAVIGITLYIGNIRGAIISTGSSELRAGSLASSQGISSYFSRKLAVLESYAAGLTEEELSDNAKLTANLSKFLNKQDFIKLTYIDNNGKITDAENGILSLSTRVFAKKALESGLQISLSSDNESNYDLYSVPVIAESGKIGILVGGTDPVIFPDLTPEGWYKLPNCFIVDENGIVIFAVSEDNLFETGDDIAMILENKGNNVNLLKTAFSQKNILNSGSIIYDGTEYILAYSSLKCNDWTFISAISTDSIVDSSIGNYIQSIAVVICLVILSITLGVILFLHTMHAKIRADLFIEETKKLYYEDSITGFSSWQSFVENYTKHLKDTSLNLALLSLNINKFKAVNDALGYEGGNSIIKQLAEIIARNIGEDDLFARNTADKFYILREYSTKEDLIEFTTGLISDIDYQITAIKINVSIGIYPITDRKLGPRAVADRADLARNSISNTNQSTYAFFDTTLLDRIRTEKSIENIMESALESREFVVYLQPKFALEKGNEIVGAEALVRWYHDGKIIPPGQFIPLFEKNGFVSKLDFYMFREICRLQKEWINMGREPKIISVNMSRVHLPNRDFVNTLSSICSEYGIPPSCIEIEITESAAYENINILTTVFRQIKDAGFLVSIDDFGTGYSSLNMLKDLPVDVIKIDRSFLTESADKNENASKIIGCVVSLASSLNISTICEGIETKEQATLLTNLGCNMAQGFFFARPIPVSDFEELVYGKN